MLALAIPVVIDQIGMMSMGIVDTIMVGRLGPVPLGSVAVGGAIYFFFMVFAWGVVSAVGPTVAQAFGAGDQDEISRSTAQGFWISLILFTGGLAIVLHAGPILTLLGQSREIIVIAEQYVAALGYGMIAALWYAVLRAFTVGLGRTRVTMMISLAAALVNLILDYALIYGNLGMPRLGAVGAGYATATAQWFMFLSCLLYVLRDQDLKLYRFTRHLLHPDPRRLRRLARLGLPIGAGNSMEHGIFGLTAVLMGTLGTIALASNQVALNVAAFTFMTPLGVSTATTTRVGHAVGGGNLHDARLAGWVGIGLSGAFMVVTALLFLLLPRPIIGIYTSDAKVLEYASGLLMIAGAFQIFDGIQVGAQGALRGLKDTARPMIVNLVSYWGVGLPTAWLLAFEFDMGGAGLWWGLTCGLAVASLLHTQRFHYLTSSQLSSWHTVRQSTPHSELPGD